MMREATKRAMVSRATVMAMKVVADKESKGSKVMAMVTMVVCDKEDHVNNGKSTGNKGGKRVPATRAIVMAT